MSDPSSSPSASAFAAVSGPGDDDSLFHSNSALAHWRQYEEECRQANVRDLSGIEMEKVKPYLQLNQYQRDQLSRSVRHECG